MSDELDVNLRWPATGPIGAPTEEVHGDRNLSSPPVDLSKANGTQNGVKNQTEHPDSQQPALQEALSSIALTLDALSKASRALMTNGHVDEAHAQALVREQVSGTSQEDVAGIADSAKKAELALNRLERAASEVTSNLERVNHLLANSLGQLSGGESLQHRLPPTPAIPVPSPAASPHQLVVLNPSGDGVWSVNPTPPRPTPRGRSHRRGLRRWLTFSRR